MSKMTSNDRMIIHVKGAKKSACSKCIGAVIHRDKKETMPRKWMQVFQKFMKTENIKNGIGT